MREMPFLSGIVMEEKMFLILFAVMILDFEIYMDVQICEVQKTVTYQIVSSEQIFIIATIYLIVIIVLAVSA